MLPGWKFPKRSFWLGVLTVLSILIFLNQALALKSKKSVEIKGQLDIDLAVYQIRDEKVLEVLGAKSIPVRKESYRLPSMKLPLLELQDLPEGKIRPRLEIMAKKYADVSLSKENVKDLTDILTTQVESKIFWISKGSGAFAYFDKIHSQARPLAGPLPPLTALRICRVINLALIKVIWHNLPFPDPETLDIIFLSHVRDAVTKDGETKPEVQRVSGYYVGFGRRYRGIPVVGSRLIARLGPNGELLGVQETWRPIIGERGKVTIDASSFERRLTAALLKEKVLKPDQSVEKDILILGTAWGYLEGPVGNVQKMMVPGCVVNYRLRTQGSADQTSQIVIPLADVDYPILGTPVYFKTKEASPEKTK